MGDRSDETRLVTAGRNPEAFSGAVNPPVFHASTILFPTLEALEAARGRVTYGRHGTPGTHAFEDAMAELEGADIVRLAPSGVAAVAGVFLTFLQAGDHVLVADTVYEPTRQFCDRMLAGLGVAVTYYDPLLGAGIAEHFRPATRLVFLESPGSRSFEVQDVPAIAAAARARGILTALDNTWATPLFFKPLGHGVDLSIQAATKYIVGHSDAMLGTVAARGAVGERLKRGMRLLGLCAGPDDVHLALRGLRTLAVRLRRHEATGLALARWLAARPEVARVLHPGLPEDPGHALFRRDFAGASGLFGVELRSGTRRQLAAMLEGLALFGMGYSWGGFESLVVTSHLEGLRTARPYRAAGPLLRIHAGLEAPEDLIADLEAGFARFAAAGQGKETP